MIIICKRPPTAPQPPVKVDMPECRQMSAIGRKRTLAGSAWMVCELRLEIRHQLLQYLRRVRWIRRQLAPRLVQKFGPVLERIWMDGVAAQTPGASDCRGEICFDATVQFHHADFPDQSTESLAARAGARVQDLPLTGHSCVPTCVPIFS